MVQHMSEFPFLFKAEYYEICSSQVVLAVKNPPANAGDARDTGLIPGSGRSPGEGHGNPTFLPRKSPWTEELGGLQSMGGSKNSRIRLSN